MFKVDIIIPTYNGLDLLKKNLPAVIKSTPELNTLIIVDNGSQDNTISWLSAHYPQAKIIKNQTNLGFTKAINQGVHVSKSDYFVLLNNDVLPQSKYLQNCPKLFSNPKLFSVSFNEQQSSWPVLVWQNGKINFSRGAKTTTLITTPWSSGGSAIFCRQIWNKLGGLDEVYAPYYWEDIDIGFRAWKSGFVILWDPQSKVNHNHESTSSKLNKNYVSNIKQRNELLFNWLNITAPGYKWQHFQYLLKHCLFHPGYFKIVLLTIIRLATKKPLERKFTLSDTEVLNLIGKSYEN